eukprot:481753-Rhodomonas_salina.1
MACVWVTTAAGYAFATQFCVVPIRGGIVASVLFLFVTITPARNRRGLACVPERYVHQKMNPSPRGNRDHSALCAMLT